MPTSSAEAFGGLSGRLVWLGLMHSLWIGLLVASAAALILRVAPRRTHRARHAVLVVAMLAVAVGPIAVATGQHRACSRAERGPGPFAGAILVSRAERPGSTPARPSDPSPVRADPDIESVAPRIRFAARAIARSVDGLRRSRPVVISVWLVAVAASGTILMLGGLGLRRLCREAESAPVALQDRSRRLARLLRLRRMPTILVHAGPAEPFLCGLFRPAIVLPRPWVRGAPPEWLDAVLAHELAHARRGDHLVNLAQRLIEVGLFFHPAVHWLSSSLRRERELCADALAVRLTGDPLSLAEALQSVARLRLESPRAAAVVTSLGGPSISLLTRIQELIGMTPSRPRFPVWPFAALPAAGFLALIATAAGFAEEPPSPPVTPPPARAGEDHGSPGRPAAPLALAGSSVEVTVSDPTSAGGVARDAVDYDRQIAFDVRFITGLAGTWRSLLLDRLNLVKQQADVAAWTLDDPALHDLLTQAQSDTSTNVLQAPKVTTFDKARATITNRHKLHYVAGVDRIEHAGHPGFRPIVKDLDVGSKLDMTGTIVPGGTRLSVDLSDAWLLALRTMLSRQQVGPEIYAAQYQIPTMVDRRCQVACELPQGSHLLISLGLYDKPEEAKGLTALANVVISAAGLPTLRRAPETFERLVVITPLPIILESEERPVHPVGRANPR